MDSGLKLILENPESNKDIIMEKVYNGNKDQWSKLCADRAFLSGWCSNQLMYVHREKIAIESKIDLRSIDPSGIIDLKEWFPCNPSICHKYSNDGYFILLRLVNFSSERATNYISHSKDGKFSTRNLLLNTDTSFNVISWKEVLDISNRKIYPRQVQGLEDMQIFQIKEKNKKNKHKRLGFVCTLVDCQSSGTPLIGFGLISINTGQISKIKFLQPLAKDNCEKNWLPWWFNGGINLLYHGSNMLRLFFKLDEFANDSESIRCEVLGFSAHRKELRDVRGSAGPIPFNEGFLLLFHEVIWINNGRTYIHRFVYVDKDFKVEKISHFFCFELSHIEFARSMTKSLTNNNILICAGVEDHNAYIYEVSPKVVNEMLIFK